MTKDKALRYTKYLKQFDVEGVDSIQRFEDLLLSTSEPDIGIMLHHTMIEICIAGNPEDYLMIFSDNTARCSEDEYSKFIHFNNEVFEVISEL